MKLLLISAGVKNPSIEKATVGLMGKPIAECHALWPAVIPDEHNHHVRPNSTASHSDGGL